MIRPVEVPAPFFNLSWTMRSGQLFRWTPQPEGYWSGCVDDLVLSIRQNGEQLLVSASAPAATDERVRQAVTRLFRLDAPLPDIQSELLGRDPGLAAEFEAYKGLRVTSQPPVECLLTFVCAVATSIERIRWSISELSSKLGCDTGCGDWCFPSLEVLAAADPSDLRVGAMEFRCRSLSGAARALQERGGHEWLMSLRQLGYERASDELVRIPHVGRKVADCALLFSLGFDEAFPLDTHTRRIARERYGIEAADTPKGYAEVSGRLRDRLGPWAGWAQQYLYLGSLDRRKRLPAGA